MASPISANRAELLAIATSVATEKMIDKSIVIEAMEEAIQKSARNRYGAENDIRAKLDPRTGDLRLWRVGDAHFAAHATVVADEPQTADAYRARVAHLPALVHLSIEVNHCPHANAR